MNTEPYHYPEDAGRRTTWEVERDRRMLKPTEPKLLTNDELDNVLNSLVLKDAVAVSLISQHIATLDAQNQQLRKYAMHNGDCMMRYDEPPCSCGLDAILRDVKVPK